MTYQQTLDYLYSQLAMYQRIGSDAYKPGLGNAIALDNAFGNPHRNYATIHVAGTNGKGSTAHTLAAVLQKAGYRTGLYTSPHLIDFRERIRIDGEMISREEVVDFVERYLEKDLPVSPSFFELTMTMAFEHFARHKVDVAVIEVGLGGRLDSTNIITPVLSVITNISKDHTALLGNTLPEIAREKAGIIKPGAPVVVGEAEGEVRKVFADKAAVEGSEIIFACDNSPYSSFSREESAIEYRDTPFGNITSELTGDCQLKNAATVLTALSTLIRLGFAIPSRAVREGFAEVTTLTGLAGRWMVLNRHPFTVCDTGHNIGGWQYLAPKLNSMPGIKHLVLGFVNDKDVSSILRLVKEISPVRIYWAAASVNRALPSEELASRAAELGLHGTPYLDVAEAYMAARNAAAAGDTIFVGGSTFVVADLLSIINN
ncbi:MAG: bifunctional folylpolyglutamate synthase/dihydrofolate synthase [Paramuribaculum sp.]|nr:bifunctional folylpolyglutamate synthase/dihydrofolate synthase [Paramuribaculum sp.]MDE6303566.1 bifunctional folylpolyglutamate synthase/dihydrofolate synthase [Paramuribaculum sp.]